MKTIFDENYLPNNNYFVCVCVVFVLERVIFFHKGFSSLGIINTWDQMIFCWGAVLCALGRLAPCLAPTH